MSEIKPEVIYAIQPATSDEVVDMIVEAAKLEGTPEMRAVAIKLFSAGYTLRVVSKKMGVGASVLWRWAEDADVKGAIAKGKAYRRKVLVDRLEEVSDDAITALSSVVSDEDVAPKDRIKAAEVILDRSGLTVEGSRAETTPMLAVSIDFDERLAQIVAGHQPKH